MAVKSSLGLNFSRCSELEASAVHKGHRAERPAGQDGMAGMGVAKAGGVAQYEFAGEKYSYQIDPSAVNGSSVCCRWVRSRGDPLSRKKCFTFPGRSPGGNHSRVCTVRFIMQLSFSPVKPARMK